MNIDGASVLTNAIGHIGRNSGSAGTAKVSGTGSSWINSTNLYIGNQGTGALIIEAGGTVRANGGAFSYLAFASGSTGEATVTGAESKWINESNLLVGNQGSGTLSVIEGGQVSSYYGYLGYSAGSSGTAVVSGPGSTWGASGPLYIGNKGNASLTIESGGQINSTSSQQSYIGYDNGSTGSAIVSGAGSMWTSASGVYVGYSGNGTLKIEAGGQVSTSISQNSYLGYKSGSTGSVTVTGAGSTWGTSNTLHVGSEGSGALTISDGGQVISQQGSIARGSVIVNGAGSRWTNTSSLYVRGNGTLSIESGGQVSNTDGYVGGSSGTNSAVTVTGTGSAWNNIGNLWVSEQYPGTLTVADGGLVTAQTLYASSSDLRGNGTISANGAVMDADLVFDRTHGTVPALVFGALRQSRWKNCQGHYRR